MQVVGTPAATTYRHLAPALERLLQGRGKVRVLVEMSDFHGWTERPLRPALTGGLTRLADVERLALVGDRRCERAAVAFFRPFTTATIRFFDRAAIHWARAWLKYY
jgi:hypothetical protein